MKIKWYFTRHDGVYLIPTIAYIWPDEDWSYYQLTVTWLHWTAGVNIEKLHA